MSKQRITHTQQGSVFSNLVVSLYLEQHIWKQQKREYVILTQFPDS